MTLKSFSFEARLLRTDSFSKELDYPIKEVFFLENTQNFIVLYDRNSNIRKWGQFPNLVCFSHMGEKIWTAELPTTDTGDCYLHMKLQGGKLFANAWGSYDCEIDIHTGKIKHKVFVK